MEGRPGIGASTTSTLINIIVSTLISLLINIVNEKGKRISARPNERNNSRK